MNEEKKTELPQNDENARTTIALTADIRRLRKEVAELRSKARRQTHDDYYAVWRFLPYGFRYVSGSVKVLWCYDRAYCDCVAIKLRRKPTDQTLLAATFDNALDRRTAKVGGQTVEVVSGLLYNEGCLPIDDWENYCAKLKHLMRLKAAYGESHGREIFARLANGEFFDKSQDAHGTS